MNVKAAHYIQELDEARCEGNWDVVPELVRKIRKHAPTRICLTLTAEIEYAVTQFCLNRPTPTSSRARPTSRPSTAGSTAAGLSKYLLPLTEAIENERQYLEDDFQARVCFAWIHWVTGEHASAASALPDNIEGEFSQLDGTNKESTGWTRVCALKALYIKGDSQRRTGKVVEALETFNSGLPILSSVSATPSPPNKKELTAWIEVLLTGFCMLSSHAMKMKITSILETEALTAFRAWAKFWDWFPVKSGGRALNAEVSRRHVWKEFYITLSEILQKHLPYPTTALTTAYTDSSTKLQQRAELKRIETCYETLLLSEVQFPKAEESSEEVEAFVELVIQNWQVLCGTSWQDHDFGEGGAEGVSRGVLDILYRAATKTFHSTAILRYLFTVHLAVAEFDLAFKAFDTYLEIVKRGKARMEKTGESDHALDNDELVLKTASECIRALCRYGSRSGAEKAKDLGQYFEEWLEKHHPIQLPNGNQRLLENGNSIASDTPVSPRIFAMAWRSIGIGYAQWARLTFDASSRADLQLKAMKCFKRALLPQYQSTSDVETLFALGTVLAERRELTTAIQILKVALAPQHPESSDRHLSKYTRERSLIPLWHLMALLLSARQDFMAAVKSCDGVFDQFEDPKHLFGDSSSDDTFRSEHLNSNEKLAQKKRGLVDEMDDFEKENILEVKMTQLSLIEILEGSDVAVNSSDELLGLYTRLFGEPPKERIPSPVQNLVPPKSSAGTLRSMKGSIFGRSLPRSMRKDMGAITESSGRPDTAQSSMTTMTSAPTIHVTNENGTGRRHHEKLHKKNSVKRAGSRVRSASVSRLHRDDGAMERGPIEKSPTSIGEAFFTPPEISEPSTEGFSRSLPPASQQMDQEEPSLQSTNHNTVLPQDTRLPVSPFPPPTSPITRFSKDSERRRRTSMLVKVWLLIAGFYRRATMYEDAKGAIEEAHKLVYGLEMDVLNDPTGLATFENAGWGGGKSVAELWADVFSERGHLAVERSTPYVGLENYESALNHFADHPAAIVGLSDLLLSIYTEELLPLPTISPLVLPSTTLNAPSASTLLTSSQTILPQEPSSSTSAQPLGIASGASTTPLGRQQIEAPESKSQTAQLDRLAARDRAYGLLSALTKLGTGWNYAEAWYSLARAYELGGQVDKAKEVLWWCVELEEGKGLRNWECVSAGGYVL